MPFSGRPPPGNGGPYSDVFVSDNGVWIWIVTGFHRSWEATSVVIRRKQQYKPHLFAKQKVYSSVAACCTTLPTGAPSASPRRWDRILMVSTTRALPLSSQLRLRHSPSSATTCLVEDEGSRRLGKDVGKIDDGREHRHQQAGKTTLLV